MNKVSLTAGMRPSATRLSLLKAAALRFDKLVLLDPVGASWDTIGADDVARDAVWQLD